MSKNEITYEQAQEAASVKKEALKAVKAEAKEFRKENKLRPDDTPTDEKLAKKLAKLTSAVEKAQKEYDDAVEAMKALKPKTVRQSKYEYPDGMTAQEKKRFRAKSRAEARKAEKAASTPPKEKKEKEKATDEAPAKKRRVAEDED